jgi:hypothetical protein
MIVLLIKLPIIGSSPQRKVTPMTTAACGRPILRMKMAVRTVLMQEMMICAPRTVSKLW